jgi:hypothetical protein
MGVSRIKRVVHQPFSSPLLVHQDHHAQHQWQAYHGQVPVQNHAIKIPVVTATDCILKATHRLTAAIEGIQEATPDKPQAIE